MEIEEEILSPASEAGLVRHKMWDGVRPGRGVVNLGWRRESKVALSDRVPNGIDKDPSKTLLAWCGSCASG